MKALYVLLFAFVFGSFACATGGPDDDTPQDAGAPDDAPTGCDWDTPRLSPANAPMIPSTTEGELEDALMGRWQHTFYQAQDGSTSPLNETTNIRFVFPGDGTMIYCQHVTGVVEVGPNERSANLTLTDMKIGLGTAPGYTALAWSDDVMLWQNDGLPDSDNFVLQRME